MLVACKDVELEGQRLDVGPPAAPRTIARHGHREYIQDQVYGTAAQLDTQDLTTHKAVNPFANYLSASGLRPRRHDYP